MARKIASLPTVVSLASLGLLAAASGACGRSDDSDDASTPSPSPTATRTPARTPAPTPTEVVDTKPTGFWVASSSLRVLSRYDTAGVLKTPLIDLKSTLGAAGGITAMKFLDATNLLVVHDPGTTTAAESIALVDSKKGVVKSKGWFTDATNFNQVSSYNLITGFIANTLLVPNGTRILRMLYDASLNPSSAATSFLDGSSVSGCPHTSIEFAQTLTFGSTKHIILLSSGTEQRINAISLAAGSPRCGASLVYSEAGQPATTADVPSAAVRMADGRLYVLYQHPSASKIVSYAFDGSRFSDARLVFSDQAILGAKPRALFARSALRMLVANTDDDKIFEISTAGAFTGFFVDNSFTQDVSVIELAP